MDQYGLFQTPCYNANRNFAMNEGCNLEGLHHASEYNDQNFFMKPRANDGRELLQVPHQQFERDVKQNSWDQSQQTQYVNNPYLNEIFGFNGSEGASLMNYSENQFGENPIISNTCGDRFTKPQCLDSHMRVHAAKKLLACNLCDFKCNFKEELNFHKTKSHKKLFECESCDFKCIFKYNMIDHMKIHNNEKLYICRFCGREFAQKQAMLSHVQYKHKEEPPAPDPTLPIPMQSCPSIKPQLVMPLMAFETSQKPFGCGVCGYRYSTEYNLKVHFGAHIF